jgi:hypothetical protein
MNSANRLTPNSARKIHSDQKPRRFALKFSMRRRVAPAAERDAQIADFEQAHARRLSKTPWPDLIRPPTSFLAKGPGKDVDARVKPGQGAY